MLNVTDFTGAEMGKQCWEWWEREVLPKVRFPCDFPWIVSILIHIE